MNLEGKARTATYLIVLVLILVGFAVLLFIFTRRVDGVSMRPTLEAGDMVVLQFTNITDVKVGDIVQSPSPKAEPSPQDAIYAMLDAARVGDVKAYLTLGGRPLHQG